MAKLEKENFNLKQRLDLLEKGIFSVSQVLADKKKHENPVSSIARAVLKNSQGAGSPVIKDSESPLTGHASKVTTEILEQTQRASMDKDPIQTLIDLMEASLGSFHSMLDAMEKRESSRRSKRERLKLEG